MNKFKLFKQIFVILFFAIFCEMGSAFCQTQTIEIPAMTEDVCMTVTRGTEVTFNRDLADCPRQALIIPMADVNNYTEFSGESFSFTFDEVGEYNINCDCPTATLACDKRICITVVEEIPTLGEWGIIILFLGLLIFGLVAVRASVLNSRKLTN